MRAIVAALLLAAVPFVIPAKAADPHWCAVWSDGARNCAYTSMARCQEATAGAGGKCVAETPADAAPAKATAAKAPNDDLDKLLDRVNKKSDNLILCRGC
jgi:hypothetical protein